MRAAGIDRSAVIGGQRRSTAVSGGQRRSAAVKAWHWVLKVRGEGPPLATCDCSMGGGPPGQVVKLAHPEERSRVRFPGCPGRVTVFLTTRGSHLGGMTLNILSRLSWPTSLMGRGPYHNALQGVSFLSFFFFFLSSQRKTRNPRLAVHLSAIRWRLPLSAGG